MTRCDTPALHDSVFKVNGCPESDAAMCLLGRRHPPLEATDFFELQGAYCGWARECRSSTASAGRKLLGKYNLAKEQRPLALQGLGNDTTQLQTSERLRVGSVVSHDYKALSHINKIHFNAPLLQVESHASSMLDSWPVCGRGCFQAAARSCENLCRKSWAQMCLTSRNEATTD